MKIVCLVGSHPRCCYFVNRVHELAPVARVVVEEPSGGGEIAAALKAGGVAELAARIRGRIEKQLDKGYRRRVHAELFGERADAIDAAIPRLDVEKVNDDRVFDQLSADAPDLLLDIGTSVVKKRIVATAKLALNVHAGLSPYYRGSNATDWALINWDPFNVGVTVHKMVPKIDAGGIFAQARPEISADDTSYSLDMKLTLAGTDLVLEAVRRLQAGEELAFAGQDLSQGFLKVTRQWSPALRRYLREINKKGKLAVMLQRPSRKHRLPIVELEQTPR